MALYITYEGGYVGTLDNSTEEDSPVNPPSSFEKEEYVGIKSNKGNNNESSSEEHSEDLGTKELSGDSPKPMKKRVSKKGIKQTLA